MNSQLRFEDQDLDSFLPVDVKPGPGSWRLAIVVVAMIQLKQITLDNTNKSIIKEFDTTQALYNEIISAESELINEEIIDEDEDDTADGDEDDN